MKLFCLYSVQFTQIDTSFMPPAATLLPRSVLHEDLALTPSPAPVPVKVESSEVMVVNNFLRTKEDVHNLVTQICPVVKPASHTSFPNLPRYPFTSHILPLDLVILQGARRC